jgi:hypothetical protein
VASVRFREQRTKYERDTTMYVPLRLNHTNPSRDVAPADIKIATSLGSSACRAPGRAGKRTRGHA